MSVAASRLLRILFDASSNELCESNAYFAKQLNCSERTVSRALADLVERGFIEADHYRASMPGEVARRIRVSDIVADLYLAKTAER